MTAISQIAVELLGRRGGVAGSVKLAGGYTNKVWRAFGRNGDAYIVKQYRSPWTRGNEERAIQVLGPRGLAPSAITARGATLLVWADDGVRPLRRPDEWACREIGYALRRVHEQPSAALGRGVAEDRPEWRTVNRVARRVAEAVGFARSTMVPIHGDACLENVFATPHGGFARFGDFEEFGLGDPMADLALCLAESICTEPERAATVVDWISLGYLGAAPDRPEWWSLFAREDVRSALADATLDELTGWASRNRETALANRYQVHRALVVDTLVATAG